MVSASCVRPWTLDTFGSLGSKWTFLQELFEELVEVHVNSCVHVVEVHVSFPFEHRSSFLRSPSLTADGSGAPRVESLCVPLNYVVFSFVS